MSGVFSLQKGTWGVFETLLGAVLLTLLVLYIQWHWSRRHMYYLASKVKGPILLPFIGSAHLFFGGNDVIFKVLRNIFETYPPLCKIWLGHKLFFFIGKPEHINIVANKALQKEDLYKFASDIIGSGLFAAKLHKWKKNRKIIVPTFNQKIIDGFVPIFYEQGEVLNEQLKKHCGHKNVDVFELISRATLDTICETAMGYKNIAQTTNSPFGKWVDRAFEIFYQRMLILPYHYDFIFNLTPLSKENKEVIGKIKAVCNKVVDEKIIECTKKIEEKKLNPEAEIYEDMGKRKAFLDYLIEVTHESENKFSNKELTDEVITFMLAGSDTTASSDCFILMALGMFKDIQDKVFDEIMEVIGPDREIEYSDIPKLKYLDTVIKETLRLFPIGAGVVRSIETDLELDNGVILPAGSSAVLGILSVHRNPIYWTNPLNFDPDRFLPENAEKIVSGSYVPFVTGPRNCIGLRYAMAAMTILIACIIRKYEVCSDYKNIDEIELKMNLILRPNHGFKVYFEERK